jgi:D-alanine-D-alanine ligase
MVKPNFEGSSKGITQDSIAENVVELKGKVAAALAKYPAGVLVEEYVSGKDLTVPFLAALDNDYAGVLAPVEYVVDPAKTSQRRYQIYDYELKTKDEKAVSVRAPAAVTPETAMPAKPRGRREQRTVTAVRAVPVHERREHPLYLSFFFPRT